MLTARCWWLGANPSALPKRKRRPFPQGRLPVCIPANSRRMRRAFLVLVSIIVKMEQVEQIPNRRAVERYIGIVFVHHRVGQIVAAAGGERLQLPVALDELYDRGMV